MSAICALIACRVRSVSVPCAFRERAVSTL